MSKSGSRYSEGDYEKEIRRLVIQRNRIANRMSKQGDELNAVSIPLLNWKDVTSNIMTKRDYENQVKILNAFINAPKDFENYNAVTISIPYKAELEKRIELRNAQVQREINYAKRLGKVAYTGGQLFNQMQVSMGNTRIKERQISLRQLEDFRTPYEFQQYAERVYKATDTSGSIAKWQDYKDNYITGVKRMLDDSTDEEAAEYGKAVIEKLQNTSLTKFRDIYYSDILGDIDYLQSDERNKNDAIMERLTTVDNMFGLNVMGGE